MIKLEVSVGGLSIIVNFANVSDNLAQDIIWSAISQLAQENNKKNEGTVCVRVKTKGSNPISLIKEVRAATGLMLKEAKHFVDCVPSDTGLIPTVAAEKLLKECFLLGVEAEIRR